MSPYAVWSVSCASSLLNDSATVSRAAGLYRGVRANTEQTRLAPPLALSQTRAIAPCHCVITFRVWGLYRFGPLFSAADGRLGSVVGLEPGENFGVDAAGFEDGAGVSVAVDDLEGAADRFGFERGAQVG